MLENKEIRRLNAHALLENLYDSNLSKMAREMTKHYGGTIAPSTVRRWFYNGDDSRNIGSNMARLIEKTAGKPVGWLDVEAGTGVEWEERYYDRVPILGLWGGSCDTTWMDVILAPTDTGEEPDGFLNVPRTGPDVMAAEIRGSCYSPAVRPGWFVVLNPSIAPKAGDLVGVTTKNKTASVKEFLWHNTPYYTLANVTTAEREDVSDEDVKCVCVITHIVPPSQRTG